MAFWPTLYNLFRGVDGSALLQPDVSKGRVQANSFLGAHLAHTVSDGGPILQGLVYSSSG